MKKISIIAGLIVSAVGMLMFYLNGSRNATLNRPIFDHLDKRNLKTAYRAVFRDVMAGKIDADKLSEAQMDALLIERYDQMGFN
jgi:hypothetical protein